MPDLITIQGEIPAVRSLADIPTLQIIDETAKRLDDDQVIAAAFADEDAQTAARGLGLTVTLIKTEAQYEADVQEAFAAISDTPYDFGGNV